MGLADIYRRMHVMDNNLLAACDRPLGEEEKN